MTVTPWVAASWRAQGVRQLAPVDVAAVAPGGLESSWRVTTGGAGVKKSIDGSENEEQPARLMPAAAKTPTRPTTRRILHPSSLYAANRRIPGKTIRACLLPRNGWKTIRYQKVNANRRGELGG